jgi:glycosyltransferase involved in cell wall biosynthesis
MEAVDRLVGEGLELELWIAGEGAEREALERRRAALRRPERVRLLGFREDTVALFEAFDVFCLSSLREGLPNVVLEAMAMEVPVLATRSGGMQGFARDGEDALLCDPGSADELAVGLRRLAGDAALRRRLAQAARQRIAREHAFAQRMRKVVAVYDRLGISAALPGGGA